jgi:hypothetical protein
MRKKIFICFIVTILAVMVAAETENIQVTSKNNSMIVSFNEDFGQTNSWYRWNSPAGWYCRKSKVPGVYGGLATINNTPEGMDGAHLICGYRRAYYYPCVSRLLPEGMSLKTEGVAILEISVRISGENAALGQSLLGFVSDAKLEEAEKRTYLTWDNSSENFFGIKMAWHASRPSVTVNRLLMQTQKGVFGEIYKDSKYPLTQNVTYRIRFRMDIGNDKVALDIKTFKNGKWGNYEQVFDWKPAGIDLSEQNINAIVLSPAGNKKNFFQFDDLQFCFAPTK